MENSLTNSKLENHVYYVQQLNLVLSRTYQSKKASSIFMIKLKKQKFNDDDIINQAIVNIKKYDFDHIGKIRNINVGDMESDDYIIAAHKLRDEKQSVDSLIENLSDDLSKTYGKEHFKIKGILYQGNKEMNAEQALKELNSALMQ